MQFSKLKISYGLASMAFTAHSFKFKPATVLTLSPFLCLANNHCARVFSQNKGLSAPSSIKPAKNQSFFKLFARLIELFFIFLPSSLTLPLCLFSSLRKIWMKIFAWSIENAGVVWIKLFQYLSHRGDVIGDELADMFVYLREFCPEHSFEETRSIFRKIYGVEI